MSCKQLMLFASEFEHTYMIPMLQIKTKLAHPLTPWQVLYQIVQNHNYSPKFTSKFWLKFLLF